MTYTLTRTLIDEPQQVAPDVCLADWQDVPGFDLDDPGSANLILPAAVKARMAGRMQTLLIERPGDSSNTGGFGRLVPRPCWRVVLHWWGNPVGQSHDGIVAWLRNPISQVSAHFVVSPGRATQILPLTSPSWANGNTEMNATSITLECDPNDTPGTIITVTELLVDLQRAGDLHPDYDLTGHQDHYPTACPGSYYPRLAAIRQAARAPITGDTATPDTKEDDMTPDQDAKLKDIWWRLTQPEGLATIAGAVLDVPVQRGGMEGTSLDGPTTLRNELGWLTSAQSRMINTLTALEERLARLEARQ